MELQSWLNEVLRKHAHERDSKVCVISVIGKSPHSDFWNKINPVNEALGRKVFGNFACVDRKIMAFGCEVSVYFDTNLQTIFIHLVGPFDLSNQQQLVSSENDSFYDWWRQREEIYAAHLLTLFLTSHIVLVIFPTCRFDLSYFRLFHVLENMRLKTQPAVCDLLTGTTGVSKGWSSNGRLCAPRALFAFHRPPSFMKSDGTVETKQGSYKKFERSMEDQIYGLFRKSRIITNNTANALFALPSNHPFAYVFPPNDEPKDFIQDLLNGFRPPATKEHSDAAWDKSGEDHSNGFKNFLMQHVDLAHCDGFNDNLGKTGSAFFELPKLKAFVRGLDTLYNYFVVDYQNNIELEELPDSLDVTKAFSEGRCKKVLPMALSTYMDGLPPYYASTYHASKLAQALQVLQQQARGPALEATRNQLVEECERHWRDGCQACEVLSLTGNHCVNRVHRTKELDTDDETCFDEDGQALPLLRHTSKIKYLSTCNCGRRQAWRDDPFDVREANYGYYESRDEFSCCQRRTLDRIEYPIYVGAANQASSEDLGAETEDWRARDDGEVGNSRENATTDSEQRRRDAKEAERMFDNLQLATQSQEHGNSRGPSAGEDFLPDRDNKPTTMNVTQADMEEFVDATADNEFVKTQEGQTRETAEKNKKADYYEQTETSGDNEAVRRRRQAGADRASSTFSDLLNDEAYLEAENDLSGEFDDAKNAGDLDNENPTELDEDETVEDDKAEDRDEESNRTRRSPKRAVTEKENASRQNSSENEEQDARKRSDSKASRSKKANLERDGQDYLSGMVHSLCPTGLLPLFSSWSLVCIGPSSLYSHSHGLRDQPNFSHGSNFLLPWDLQLNVNTERWQEAMEAMTVNSLKRSGPYKKPRQPKKGSDGAVTVKVFVGFEYECPRGHRFMLQAPDRILKHASGSGSGPKDNGGMLIKNDAPLWFSCSCRQTKSAFLGQLMRVHIVTPKAPVIVTVNPRVQPSSATPGKPPVIFHPGAPGPAKLDPAQYWVLRLPFVYVGPDGPYYPPRENETADVGRVIRGMINVFPDLEQ